MLQSPFIVPDLKCEVKTTKLPMWRSLFSLSNADNQNLHFLNFKVCDCNCWPKYVPLSALENEKYFAIIIKNLKNETNKYLTKKKIYVFLLKFLTNE